MDTYLLWALNIIFEELLAPFAASSLSQTNNPVANFSSLMAPLTSSSRAESAPLPQTGSVADAIHAAAAATGLSPALLTAVASVESGLNPNAVSAAGAIGLMQLMPTTAEALGVNPDNTWQNALGGAEYLKTLLNQFGHNLSLALAAYNAGPGAVEAYGGIPPYAQTEQYVKEVLAQYQAYATPRLTPEGSSSTG
ncbi:MAG: lytic transglycosylase domain-containing protein [Firmicutes bacterium]|nr:lytic transglycosylase domain-containing protein [Bacillota bacterium]